MTETKRAKTSTDDPVADMHSRMGNPHLMLDYATAYTPGFEHWVMSNMGNIGICTGLADGSITFPGPGRAAQPREPDPDERQAPPPHRAPRHHR
jgi:hypothetical protein